MHYVGNISAEDEVISVGIYLFILFFTTTFIILRKL